LSNGSAERSRSGDSAAFFNYVGEHQAIAYDEIHISFDQCVQQDKKSSASSVVACHDLRVIDVSSAGWRNTVDQRLPQVYWFLADDRDLLLFLLNC
jgi:hypothetical protein